MPSSCRMTPPRKTGDKPLQLRIERIRTARWSVTAVIPLGQPVAEAAICPSRLTGKQSDTTTRAAKPGIMRPTTLRWREIRYSCWADEGISMAGGLLPFARPRHLSCLRPTPIAKKFTFNNRRLRRVATVHKPSIHTFLTPSASLKRGIAATAIYQ